MVYDPILIELMRLHSSLSVNTNQVLPLKGVKHRIPKTHYGADEYAVKYYVYMSYTSQ
jgi:hypothetical protein